MVKKYYVLLIDVIASSKLSKRDRLTEQMTGWIADANRIFSEHCYAPFEVTKGDEVAGVLTSIATGYNIIDTFREAIFPATCRSVIVYDELTAGLGTKRSTIIDGRAFSRGNEIMMKLKKTQKTFALATGSKELDEVAGALVNLLLWRWNALTGLQRRIVRTYQQERNQTKVANILNRMILSL